MMTEFYQEDYRIRSVRIGEQSSLPGLEGLANVQQNTKAVLDEDDEIFLGYGFRSNVFPYRPQDVYTREQTERCYRSIVLENEFLRARFLPELGGRLISLTDKASGRDLLYQNKTLYAGNLAMRNSWFSGGVEWNASIIGHNPFTCSPLFAARTQLADGTPVLRMYEYERLRGVSFQMDFFLPDGSRVLFARMRLVNENAQTVPTYWWSNIAVPEWRGGRVVVPADAAYVARDGVIFKDSVPVDRGGDDVTYPVNNPKAVDHFWKIAPERRKYIAHLNADGWGLVQASTHRQRGRKLFVWGQTRGSARWQEFLSGNPHDRYIEIQAGLAQTQYECLPMPPHTAWEWLEAYGAMNAGPAQIHGAWHGAQAAVENLLLSISQKQLECHIVCRGSTAPYDAQFRQYCSYEDVLALMTYLRDLFKTRAAAKKEYAASHTEAECEAYLRSAFPPVIVLFEDYNAFCAMSYSPGTRVSYTDVWETLLKNGRGYGVTFLAVWNRALYQQNFQKQAVQLFLSYQTGVHLGGKLDAQRAIETGLSITEQARIRPPETGFALEGTRLSEVYLPRTAAPAEEL